MKFIKYSGIIHRLAYMKTSINAKYPISCQFYYMYFRILSLRNR